MTDYNAQAVEARKMGLRQTRDKDGDWIEIRFQLHHDDAYNVGLSSMPIGTRVSLVVAELVDDGTAEAEQPSEATTRPKGGPLSQEAGRLCAIPAFQEFIYAKGRARNCIWPIEMTREEAAAAIVRHLCQIESRAELDHDDNAAITFKELTDAYYASQRGQDDESLQRMRDRA